MLREEETKLSIFNNEIINLEKDLKDAETLERDIGSALDNYENDLLILMNFEDVER